MDVSESRDVLVPLIELTKAGRLRWVKGQTASYTPRYVALVGETFRVTLSHYGSSCMLDREGPDGRWEVVPVWTRELQVLMQELRDAIENQQEA
jgi:hypothetical protein